MTNTTAAPDNGVHIGHDGYLFLEGGAHGVFNYFTGRAGPPPQASEIFTANMEARQAYCTRTGRLFRMVVFPEKCVALRNYIKSDAAFRSLYHRKYAERINRSAAAPFIRYPIKPLDDNTDAFPKTDTHYNARGVLGITKAITADIFPDQQAEFDTLANAKVVDREGFCGDLGRKFDPPHVEVSAGFRGGILPTTVAANGIKGGNDGICILTSSPQSLTDKTLLICGDSFFRQILGPLSVFYRRIIFCRTRFLHYEIVDAINPDHIFCGVAERYLSNVRADADRPHFLSYPFVLGRPMEPEARFSDLWQKFIDRKALVM